MKLYEITGIPTLDPAKLMKRIADKMSVYPEGCVTRRETVQVFEFKDPSIDEVEEMMQELDHTVTKALFDFHKKNLAKLEKLGS